VIPGVIVAAVVELKAKASSEKLYAYVVKFLAQHEVFVAAQSLDMIPVIPALFIFPEAVVQVAPVACTY